jgi:hypothetical protein
MTIPEALNQHHHWAQTQFRALHHPSVPNLMAQDMARATLRTVREGPLEGFRIPPGWAP